jgi:hypothetical protein
MWKPGKQDRKRIRQKRAGESGTQEIRARQMRESGRRERGVFLIP